jgi:large subunit ribosomal protein L22
VIAKAIARHVRMTPRKVGYVAAPLRRQTVAAALAQLSVINRRAAEPVAKLVASAFANARQKFPDLREEDVVISKLVANEGPRWKRFRAAAFGRAARILKRTTHIVIELDRAAGRAPVGGPAPRAAVSPARRPGPQPPPKAPAAPHKGRKTRAAAAA